MVKASALAITNADTPMAPAATCTSPPRPVPTLEARPSPCPPASVRAATYNMPGPGEMAITKAVKKKSARVARSIAAYGSGSGSPGGSGTSKTLSVIDTSM